MADMLDKNIVIGAILDSVAHQRHQMRANEFTPGNRDLIIFDIDDTLLHTTAKIKVVDANGNIVRELTNQEFNNYKLQPGEQFDFGEFRNAEKFRQESKPIVPMIRKLKTILSHAGNAKVIMLTARADFDDKETFLQTFADLGIDMSRVHVHRAGNLPGNESPAYKKAIWVRKYLNTKQYGHVRLYDDSMSNLKVFKDLKKEYPQVDFRAIYVGPSGSTQVIESQDEYEIHNYEKLDGILSELADLVVKGQRKDSDKYGMVAAAVLDNDNNLVKGINLPAPNGKRRHAERVAIDNYVEQYGDIPKGSIIITTCSPCSEHMDERYGEDCTQLINQHGVKKVYAGYMDPTQEEEHRDFNIMETENSSIRDICKEFADTFLHLSENFVKAKGVAEASEQKYLWHGSRQKIPMLEPRQSVDTGGAAGSNQNAIYATSDPKVAIAVGGLTTPDSDTAMFPNDPQMVLFSGKIRKG
jgi:pyrimidine deaminase RibD-like protein